MKFESVGVGANSNLKEILGFGQQTRRGRCPIEHRGETYVRTYVPPCPDLGPSGTSWGFPEAGSALPEAGLGLPEASSGLPEAGLGLPEAGWGLLADSLAIH